MASEDEKYTGLSKQQNSVSDRDTQSRQAEWKWATAEAAHRGFETLAHL